MHNDTKLIHNNIKRMTATIIIDSSTKKALTARSFLSQKMHGVRHAKVLDGGQSEETQYNSFIYRTMHDFFVWRNNSSVHYGSSEPHSHY